MSAMLLTVCMAILTVSGGSAHGAEGYQPGHGALDVFDAAGMAVTPTWVKAWLAIMLLTQRPFLNENEGKWFRIWTGAMTIVILFSFVFDIRAAVIYIVHITSLSG